MSEEQKEKWYKSFTKEQLIERCEYLQRSCERKENSIMELEMEMADSESIIKEVREYIEKELGNINTNENILAQGICLKIKEIIGSDKE